MTPPRMLTIGLLVLGLLASPFEAAAQGTPPTPTPPDSAERGGRPSTKQLLRQLGGAPAPTTARSPV